jgi:hypothetical protein
MGIFGGSSKVNNTTETNVQVSVDPSIDIDIGSLAAAQTDAAKTLGGALQSGVGKIGESAETFGLTLQSSASNVALAMAGGALLLALRR